MSVYQSEMALPSCCHTVHRALLPVDHSHQNNISILTISVILVFSNHEMSTWLQRHTGPYYCLTWVLYPFMDVFSYQALLLYNLFW